MAAKTKLKVYRTAIGFHDAYVAAPSKKAALAAWGTTKDLFARNAAELVEDADLAAEPLAHPGEVIKRSRGTTADQIAALPAAKPAKAKTPKTGSIKATPRPSRAAIDAAEQALASAEKRYARESDVLHEEEKQLADRRRTLEKRQVRETRELAAAVNDARKDYETKLKDWRG